MTIGFALSGGGAKGSFQLGALTYLYRRGITPSVITGTSVGAINAAKLAEGPGAVADLERIWLGLRTETDMYVEDPRFAALEPRFRAAVSLAVVMGPGGFLLGLDDLENEVEAVKAAALSIDALYHLTPIEGRMRGLAPWRQEFDLEAARASGIRVMVTAVGLGSGKLRYIDPQGRVYEDDDLEHPCGEVDFVDAVLASAAMPLIFSARRLRWTRPDGAPVDELHVDGGVREIVPVRAARRLGADQIYAIVCSPPLRAQQESEHNHLFGLINRAIDLLTDEIVVDETFPRPPWKWDAQVRVVQPSREVHDSKQIDPGLIRINLAYGWMRAYDAVDAALGPAARAHAAGLADLITDARLAAWSREGELARQPMGNPWQLPIAAGLLQQVRDAKARVRALVEERVRIGGAWSVPAEHAWWDGWEQHKAGLPWGSPWARAEVPAFDGFGAPELVLDAGVCPQQPPPPEAARQFWRHKGASRPSGAFLQSDHGRVGNFELLAVEAGRAVHYWRDSDAPDTPWRRGLVLPMPDGRGASAGGVAAALAAEVVSAQMFQRGRRDDHGDFEAVLHLRSVTSDWLALATFSVAHQSWSVAEPMIADGRRVTDVVEIPTLLQSTNGAGGNDELLVVHGDGLWHYWRDNDDPARPWRGGRLPQPARAESGDGSMALVTFTPDAATFIQTNAVAPGGEVGGYELVARMSAFGEPSHLASWSFDAVTRVWAGPRSIMVDEAPIRGELSRPTLVQGDFGPADGNLELLVVLDGEVVHFWRDHASPGRPWRRAGALPTPDGPGGGTAPSPASSMAVAATAPTSVAMFASTLRGSWHGGTLEAIVRMQEVAGERSHLIWYSFLPDELRWRCHGTLFADGQPITGLAPF